MAVGIAMIAGVIPVVAQEATPSPGSAAVPAGCTVVPSGLFNPRHIAVDTDGTLYIAEAGNAGDEAVYATPTVGTPAPAEPLTVHGDTGQVTKVAPDGTQTVLATGLPSYSFGTEVVGPSGIAVADGKVYVTVGGPGPLTAIAPPVPNRDSVVAIDLTTGALTTVADIGAYERSNNPDPNTVDSNLTGIAAGTDGMLYVDDAGGNTVYKVDPATGSISVLAVVPGLPSPGGAANPARGGKGEVDPVPTGVIVAPDGGVYVGLLSGAILWGTPGSAKILHIAPDGTISDAATGLNMVVSVATAPDGTLYASQFSENLLAQPPLPGSVVRIKTDGTPETAIPGLAFPYGIVFDGAGSLYVVINSSAAPGASPQGQVLRCEVSETAGAATPGAEGATSETSAAPMANADVTIDLVDIAFQPNAITIPANQDVTIGLTDDGISPHNFNIDALNVHSTTLASGGTETVTISAAPGTYQFYCNIPGHKEAGMVGTLTVQ
jgi:plastocyanin